MNGLRYVVKEFARSFYGVGYRFACIYIDKAACERHIEAKNIEWQLMLCNEQLNIGPVPNRCQENNSCA